MRLLIVLACLGLASLSGCAHDVKNIEKELIDKNKEISKEIDKLAAATDVYVANKTYTNEPNKSRIVFYNTLSFKEGGERRYAPRVGVKLHLPNLQEKLQLRFTNYDEDEAERGINENRYRTEPQESVFGTSLALFQELGKVKTEFRPRLENRKDKLQTSYLFRFWSAAERGAFKIEPELQLFARSDTGTGEFFGLNFRLEPNSVDTFTLINEQQYTDGDNTLSTNHGLRWEHAYNRSMSQNSAVILESNNHTEYHLERTTLSSTFGHQLRRNVLHYGVTPYLYFEKATKFRTRTALDLRIEIIF